MFLQPNFDDFPSTNTESDQSWVLEVCQVFVLLLKLIAQVFAGSRQSTLISVLHILTIQILRSQVNTIMLISNLIFNFPIIYEGNIISLIVIGRFVRCLNSWAVDASEQCEQCRVIWCIFPLRLNSAADSPDCSIWTHSNLCLQGVSHPGHNVAPLRLSSISSQDSGFTSQDTLFLRQDSNNAPDGSEGDLSGSGGSTPGAGWTTGLVQVCWK